MLLVLPEGRAVMLLVLPEGGDVPLLVLQEGQSVLLLVWEVGWVFLELTAVAVLQLSGDDWMAWPAEPKILPESAAVRPLSSQPLTQNLRTFASRLVVGLQEALRLLRSPPRR